MSSVNYSLKHKGVRLISPDEAWTKYINDKSGDSKKFLKKY